MVGLNGFSRRGVQPPTGRCAWHLGSHPYSESRTERSIIGDRVDVRCSSMFLGVLSRKPRWGLSWRGRVLVAAATLVAGLLVFSNIFPFLAVTQRVPSDTLVVEGWIQEFGIQTAVKEFQIGRYKHLFTTGGPVRGNGGYVNDYQTSASVGAELLKKFGISNESVQMVPSHVIGRDRTYSSAVALRNWVRARHVEVDSLNIVTEDTHARRTRLLFARAFGPNVRVGVIAVPDPDYDARHWWRYSEGVEKVIEESVAYIYALFFFHPNAREAAQVD
jgi:uncharacterized SAM-binding protein YcdF (DUF218 family)